MRLSVRFFAAAPINFSFSVCADAASGQQVSSLARSARDVTLYFIFSCRQFILFILQAHFKLGRRRRSIVAPFLLRRIKTLALKFRPTLPGFWRRHRFCRQAEFAKFATASFCANKNICI